MWRGGVLACLFCGTLALASASHAQPRSNHSDYPNKPIRIINTTSAGGPAEQVARIMGQRLTEAWGQQVVVDNRAGAAGTIGAEIVARAAPDGYTLLLSSISNAISAALYPKLNFDIVRDFAPITLLATTPGVLVVHPLCLKDAEVPALCQRLREELSA